MQEKSPTKTRSFYIDNIRIFLTSLVVLHHFAITYGGPGGWFYNESHADFPAIIPLSMFLATNQAFFMGMFFFISAYFTAASLGRKGTGTFLKDRLKRLGIPTLLFFFVLFPLTIFIRNQFIRDDATSLLDLIFKSRVWGVGPMWFVEALFLFTLVYIILQKIVPQRSFSFPKTVAVILLALFIGIVQFIIRIWLPVGWSMPITNFQFPHFVQYIVLFSLGLVAYQQKWLDTITPQMGCKWFIFVQVLIIIVFPALMIFGGAANESTEPFMGGITWQNFAYTLWEQLVGFGMILGLIGIFKKRFNNQGAFAQKLSSSAYAVYVFHPPVLLAVSATFLTFNIPQFWKFVVLAPIALAACFTVGYFAKKAPLLRKIL